MTRRRGERDEPIEVSIAGGWVQDDVGDEFPELRLRWTLVPGPARRSPKATKWRLEGLSDTISGVEAVSLRQSPAASAVRAFARQIGLDPDADRGPLEAALLDRMLRGEFQSDGLPADACKIATVETGLPVWAIDAAEIVGTLGVCSVRKGELLGRGKDAVPIEEGRLAVGDLAGPLALLFAPAGPGMEPTRRTETIALFSVGVRGVADLVIEEALWIAAQLACEPS
jgi:hypothetical protein